jgi:hypothetical protein
VAGEERGLQAGKCVIFDDSFLHEAVNRAGPFETDDPSSGPRVVLIVDVWHPDLSVEEVLYECMCCCGASSLYIYVCVCVSLSACVCVLIIFFVAA